ncbi:conserved hypothetical protein [Methylobacterium sp. 4-46]|uniref:DUF6894 family protein n=1 Tax=unclassified Methylobacterium TaxID=2615210 RepID=UPI000165C982|nr:MULTISPECIES: hypothetical protein [Methylobacterium]ACA18164.1 conserved hypothetical protein [Methylobacterium sp. 4-46]WFT77462.1 hypothetical protein QA634_19195 [Methylobacterium nodulans]
MARYRFHCTNGAECVLDTVGAEVRAPARLTARAAETARAVMGALGERADWSQWRVSVHDLTGRRVLTRPFLAAGCGPAAVAA